MTLENNTRELETLLAKKQVKGDFVDTCELETLLARKQVKGHLVRTKVMSMVYDLLGALHVFEDCFRDIEIFKSFFINVPKFKAQFHFKVE